MSGQRFGHWIIDRELGQGGMGRVFLAHADPERHAGGGVAAVKVLEPVLARVPGFLERFEREIIILRQLDHPNIVHLYDSGDEDGQHYFAMEYVDGRSLAQELEEEGRLPWPVVLDIALQIRPALKHAHDRGIIHRDLKPANLLRTTDGMVKLTDFGIARLFAGTHRTVAGGVLGTTEFLSPEQAAGKPATKRSDLYSLGVVLYMLLTGRPPFEGEPTEVLHKHRYAQFERLQRILPTIPHEIDEVVAQLLEKDPDRRPGDAHVLHRHLDTIRRKLERKAAASLSASTAPTKIQDAPHLTGTQETLSGAPGPATLMGQLVRRHLGEETQSGPVVRLLNRPIVLVPLFLLTVGLIVWSFWPPSATKTFERISAIMTAEDIEEYAHAAELMDQLDEKHPGHAYTEPLKLYREQIARYDTRREAARTANRLGPLSDAQWFWLKGLHLRQEGKEQEARQIWRAMIRGFQGVPAARAWVQLAEARLKEEQGGLLTPDERWAPVREALATARRLRGEGKLDEARAIWEALDELYAEDASAQAVREEIRRDRSAAR